MRILITIVLRMLAIIFAIMAGIKYLTYEYPDVNPFHTNILTPGITGQLIHFIIVVLLMFIAGILWKLSNKILKKDDA